MSVSNGVMFVSSRVILLGTYYFLYLNVLQVMKSIYLHQTSFMFFCYFPKENKILFDL